MKPKPNMNKVDGRGMDVEVCVIVPVSKTKTGTQIGQGTLYRPWAKVPYSERLAGGLV
jgi:hypothetical protein